MAGRAEAMAPPNEHAAWETQPAAKAAGTKAARATATAAAVAAAQAAPTTAAAAALPQWRRCELLQQQETLSELLRCHSQRDSPELQQRHDEIAALLKASPASEGGGGAAAGGSGGGKPKVMFNAKASVTGCAPSEVECPDGTCEPAPSCASPGNAAAAAEDTLVQYVVVRKDLTKKLGWGPGPVMAQACHAVCAALWLSRGTAATEAYCGTPSALDGMTKVMMEIKNEGQLLKLVRTARDPSPSPSSLLPPYTQGQAQPRQPQTAGAHECR